MVLLILAILFAIASAIGYIRDRNDEAREKRWTQAHCILFLQPYPSPFSRCSHYGASSSMRMR